VSEQRDLIAGRYRLQHRIGSGGMGHVWLAWDERLSRAVAIKQLRALGDLPDREADIAHQRAMREARLTARLEHPNAVPVFDVVDHDGQPCLVMQYVPSRSLHEILQSEGTLAPVRVAKVGAEVAAALAAAHAAEIVHRDVKPGNILITVDGTALITDFGISRAFGDAALTSTGMLTGTPAYLAPEVARGASSTPASDVFSLGSTLYAAVEGTPPFGAGENPMALLHQVASGTTNPPKLAGALSPVLEAMLDADPERRPTMQQASEALLALVNLGTSPVDQEQRQSTKVLPIAAAAAGAAVLGSEGGHTVELPSDPPTDPPIDAPSDGPRDQASEAPGDQAAVAPAPVHDSAPHAVAPLPLKPPSQQGDLVDPAKRRRRGAALLAGALALLLIAVWAVQRAMDPGSEVAQAPSVAASSEAVPSSEASPEASSGATAEPSSPSAAPTTSRAESPSTTRSPSPTTTPRAAAPAPATPAPRTTAPRTTPPAAAPAAGAAITESDLNRAVRDYYGLLPSDTDAGWELLSDRYRRTTATNRDVYERFWDSIRSVQVSDVSSEVPSSVVATLRYAFEDGRTFVERTAYSLVREDGRLKIDRSSVLSSRQA
jgi:serine/threonine protein kinase